MLFVVYNCFRIIFVLKNYQTNINKCNYYIKIGLFVLVWSTEIEIVHCASERFHYIY
jgi:hypothetical protein